MRYDRQWRPYVPVARRRREAQSKMRNLRAEGVDIQPVEIDGRKIAKTFWGEAWCDQMESHGDYSNRLPRGRTYVRNGSVCHLAIQRGRIDAMVSGSEIYKVSITIDVLATARWNQVKQSCRGQIGSLLELLQGRISSSVMQVVTDPRSGLFPAPREIHLRCNCPDYATMCKHVAAALYGVGARLDQQPELLFLLRGVNHLDLITAPADEVLAQTSGRGGRRRQVAAGDLSDVFGIELDGDQPAESVEPAAATGPGGRPTGRRRSTAKTRGGTKAAMVPMKKAAKKSRTARSAAGNAVQTPGADGQERVARKKASLSVAAPKQGAKKKPASKPATKKKSSQPKSARPKRAR
ncbi:MAG: SWIM zinc finger family protein [Pirellulaceae bacterium]|nr:SWIM zinc finger family protein [Pirellulaceae bacterium]